MNQLLAIDPGTHQTGIAIFNDGRLSWTELISAPDKMEVEERIGYIVKELEGIVQVHGKDIRQVAAERPMGINRARPAPELETLIRRIKRWATNGPHRWVWTAYSPSTVAASGPAPGVSGRAEGRAKVGGHGPVFAGLAQTTRLRT